MKPLHIALAGLALLLIPPLFALLAAFWLPLGLFLLLVGLALHLVRKYYLGYLDEE